MSRGRTQRGRSRAGRLLAAEVATRPLFRAVDQGDPVAVHDTDVGPKSDRWVEPFLEANRAELARLELRPEVRIDPRPRVLLHPGRRVGAAPLVSPATRRVVAGVLVKPRFDWSALGAVFGAIGFAVEPTLGGTHLVPGSAREVPPWILAGPVLERIAGLLNHRRRAFVPRSEERGSPRGAVEWSRWATRQVPSGRWTSFPCRFSEPDDDPDLLSAVRWTLGRLEEELRAVPDAPIARKLVARARELSLSVGAGQARRPPASWASTAVSEWIRAAVEGMGWIAEERGLGGARVLDGLAWSLAVDQVWEAWVSAVAGELGGMLGLVGSPFGGTRRALQWSGVASMESLAPDVELRGPEHVVWIDAKYKPHLQLLARHGWAGLSEPLQAQHRADLHQALAYASLSDAPRVDTVLLYPALGLDARPTTTLASVTSGRRRVRVMLASLPFGFRGPEQREASLRALREALAS